MYFRFLSIIVQVVSVVANFPCTCHRLTGQACWRHLRRPLMKEILHLWLVWSYLEYYNNHISMIICDSYCYCCLSNILGLQLLAFKFLGLVKCLSHFVFLFHTISFAAKFVWSTVWKKIDYLLAGYLVYQWCGVLFPIAMEWITWTYGQCPLCWFLIFCTV